jgi:elongator complex protein 3
MFKYFLPNFEKVFKMFLPPNHMFIKKPTKTISGVTPLAVMLPPKKCEHGICLYCPSLDAPQSYTPKSPAVLRAASLKYNPYEQVKARLNSFKAMNHPTDKIELIIMGGTFLSFPEKFQYNFIKKCYDALNGKNSKNLAEAKKLNEKTPHRCVALCIETRPDICSDSDIRKMLEFGATRVELGVQAIDDEIYKKINRGHTVKDVVDATARLRDAGFKVGYHIMPGLPGSNHKKDLEMFKKLFSDSKFRPDQIKIYPCQVIKGSELEKWHAQGKYEPYSEEEIVDLLIKMKEVVPEYCRIMRVMREIPPSYLVAGTKHIDLRKTLKSEMEKHDKECRCIRCREIGFVERDGKVKINWNLHLHKIDYEASGGKEIFMQFVNPLHIIFALCRLRIKGNTAMLRELHTFGKQIKLKEHSDEIQHHGLGKKLMAEAESIAKQHGCRMIKVLSGVGVREYYRKLGYKLDGFYMSKSLPYL